jgi:hypothetical protein
LIRNVRSKPAIASTLAQYNSRRGS